MLAYSNALSVAESLILLGVVLMAYASIDRFFVSLGSVSFGLIFTGL